MKRIYVYITSLTLSLIPAISSSQDQPPDSVTIPLKIRIGAEIAGPVIYFTDKNNLNIEVFMAGDINEKISLFASAGYGSYKYSQYNYAYSNKGEFLKVGVDFNLLKPQTNMGKYSAGIGIHYGISPFSTETPTFTQKNYWGETSSSIPEHKSWGHYLEISPGFRADLFGNLSIGWTVSIRRLIYSGTGKDLMPIYIPGFGASGSNLSFGLNYYISYAITYRKIRVASKIDKPDESEETENQQNVRTQ